MRIAVAADHNGFAMKVRLAAWLVDRGHEVVDCGTDGVRVVDYPRLCADACRLVVSGAVDRGIVIGGSGQGEQIACNKIDGIRAGLCHCLFTTEISRAHNDANVLVMGAKVIDAELAERITERWLATAFKGGVHQHRLDQIAALERGEPL